MARTKLMNCFFAFALAIGLSPSFAFASPEGDPTKEPEQTEVQDVSQPDATQQEPEQHSSNAVAGNEAMNDELLSSDANGMLEEDPIELMEAEDVLLGAPASESKVADSFETYYIQSALAEGKVLDVSGGSTANSANVQLYRLNKSTAQQWRVSYDADGYAVITNVKSGKALDVAGAKKANGTNVAQYVSNGTAAQKWILGDNGDGTISIKSALADNLALDVKGASDANGANIQIYTSNGSAAQRFELVTEKQSRASMDSKAASHASDLPDGTYLISSALSQRSVLDVSGGSTANSANVQLYSSNMTGAQQWKVTHDEKGYVTFANMKSGKVLDVAGASIAPRANIAQYSSNGTAAQKWIVTDKGDGTFSIESALWPGISVDVSGAKTANGTNIQTYPSNGSKAQSFCFVNALPNVAPCEDFGLNGKYFRISTALNPAYVLDISGGSQSNGTNVQLYSSNGTYAQLFKFEFVSIQGNMGYYHLVNAKTNKSLDIDSGNLVNGTNVQQWSTDEKNGNQLFAVQANSDGTYTFVNRASGLALDVAGTKAADSSNIQGWTPNGTKAQRFSATEVIDFIPEGVVNITSGLSGGKVLDVASGSMTDGANVQLYDSNGSLAQKWNVKKVADNTYTIQSIRSGKNLTVEPNGNVSQRVATGASNQLWTAEILKGSTVLRNVGTGKVLDVAGGKTSNGTNIQTYTANGTNAQCFSIAPVDILSNGTYLIQAFTNTSLMLDVASGSNSDGANVQLYKGNGTNAQKWRIAKNSDGTYSIRNSNSGKALDVAGAKAAVGSNIQQYSYNGSKAQKWKSEYHDGGGITLVSALDGSFAVGMASGSLASGANVELQATSASVDQRFTFEPTSYVPPLPREQLAMWNRIKDQGSGSQWLMAVDRSTHKVGVFKKASGNWSLQYYWNCVTGAPSSPTITGTFRTTGYKRTSLSTDSRAIWCTQIHGGYFFHSILSSQNELGKSLSHGCLRMDWSVARWIYDNIPVGTTVVIYN